MPQSSIDSVLVENLKTAIERSGRSAYAVAAAVDRAPNWLYRVLNGKVGILIPTLREVANELGVSAGSLLDSPDESAAKVSELEDAGALATGSHEFRPVLLTQGTGIAAGAGANADEEHVLGSLAFRDDWLRRHHLNPAQCRVIEVTGNSMEPTLQHRAVILVDFQRTVRRHNKIFALRAEDGPVVKRLQHANGKGWRLVSDNDAYKPVPWPEDAVVRGQVMWTGRTL